MAYKHIINGDFITSNSIATNNSGGILDDNICVVSATEPSTFRKKIWLQKGKNLCDANSGQMNSILSNTDGKTISAATNIWVSDYIPVRPNTQYLMTSNGSEVYVRSFFYTADKDFITTQAGSLSFTTTASTYYVRLQFDRSTYSTNLQLEQNSSITTYEAYIEPKYYVLNNNNVYEEINSNNEKQGRILYENSNGIDGDFTLSDDVSNYRYLEIFFRERIYRQGYLKILANGYLTDIPLEIQFNNGNSAFYRCASYQFSGTSATKKSFLAYNINTSTKAISAETEGSNVYIKIYKVVGWK